MTNPGSAEGNAQEDEELARLVDDDGTGVDADELPRGAQNAPDGNNLTPSESDTDS